MTRKILFYSFLFMEFIIYCSFVLLDVHNGGPTFFSNTIKYTGIILCSLFLTIYRRYINHIKPYIYIQLSLILVVFCDYILLFTSRYLWGVLLFSIIQVIYFLYIRSDFGLYRYYSIILFITALINFTVQGQGFPIQFLEIISVFYFVSLVGNIIVSLHQIRKSSGTLREIGFTIGLILFLLCDINVGIVNLISYIPDSWTFKWALYEFSTIIMWVFYLPAQMIITLSTVLRQNQDINFYNN